MFFIDTIATEGLGNQHCPAGGAQAAVAVGPPRDSDRVIATAARRGVRIAHGVVTRVHNDYAAGAACMVPTAATGAPSDRLRPGETPASFRRTVFAGRQRPA